jgi:hypothetical protein
MKMIERLRENEIRRGTMTPGRRPGMFVGRSEVKSIYSSQMQRPKSAMEVDRLIDTRQYKPIGVRKKPMFLASTVADEELLTEASMEFHREEVRRRLMLCQADLDKLEEHAARNMEAPIDYQYRDEGRKPTTDDDSRSIVSIRNQRQPTQRDAMTCLDSLWKRAGACFEVQADVYGFESVFTIAIRARCSF